MTNIRMCIIAFLQKICPRKQRVLLNTLKDNYGLTVMDKNLKIIGDALGKEKTNYWAQVWVYWECLRMMIK